MEYLKSALNYRSYLGVSHYADIFLVTSEIELIQLFTLLTFLLDPDFVGAWDIE
jgi:hypothetical protein